MGVVCIGLLTAKEGNTTRCSCMVSVDTPLFFWDGFGLYYHPLILDGFGWNRHPLFLDRNRKSQTVVVHNVVCWRWDCWRGAGRRRGRGMWRDVVQRSQVFEICCESGEKNLTDR